MLCPRPAVGGPLTQALGPTRMLKNPEAVEFFSGLSAHSDLSSELLASLSRLGEYERGGGDQFAAPYFVTAGTVFCAAAGSADTYWRLRESDIAIALATGAELAPIGTGWVRIALFRPSWPRPDLAHWALRAYDFARTGK